MKKSLVVGIALLITLVFIAALPVFAGTVSWSGSLQAPDPSWTRIGNDCVGVEPDVEWYDLQLISVDVSGDYTFEMVAMDGPLSPDGYYVLYDGGFNPASPYANCIVTDDDSGSGLAPKMTVNLVAGRTYTLMTTQCCDGTGPEDEMTYTNQITGPGNISLLAAPGACPFPLPSGSPTGRMNQTVSALWAADPAATTNVTLPAGSSWRIIGTSGDYVRLWIACQANPVWVPDAAID